MKSRTGADENLRCSFCHKSQDAVAKLISSPSDYPRAYICDECVAVCNTILDKDAAAPPPNAHYRIKTGQGLHKESWFRRVKSWWKYGMIEQATLTHNQ